MKEFGEFPNTGALLGYFGVNGFTRALQKAGRDLTVASFVKAMESLDYYDPLSDNHVNHSVDDHQGADRTILPVVEDGSWKVVARLEWRRSARPGPGPSRWPPESRATSPREPRSSTIAFVRKSSLDEIERIHI